jgi:hypothetical protein
MAVARTAAPDDPRADDSLRVYHCLPYQAKTWEQAERVVLRAKWTQGTYNPRFIVTNRHDLTGGDAYAHYCGRGACEYRIKEFKRDLAGGRTSCHRFLANQARLLFHLAAALLLAVLQDALAGTAYAAAQVGTLRTRVLKVGGEGGADGPAPLVPLAHQLSRARDLGVAMSAPRLNRAAADNRGWD